VRFASRAALLAVFVGACGGGSPPADPPEDGSVAALIGSRAVADPGDAPATPAIPSPSADAPRGEPPAQVTIEYLIGEWCFHREHGGGEAGIIEFDPDGTNRTGIYQVWAQEEYRWDVTQDLAAFRRSYPAIVDIEPDQFVGLLSGNYRVVFERAPC
jgi:hypothetical protein